MIRTIDNEIDKDEWKLLLSNSETASFFQSPECYDFYCTLSFLTPFLVGVSENNQLVGVACGYVIADGGVVKRFFSRRAIIPGGLLLADDISEQALGELLKKLTKELSKKAIYIEIRNYNDYSKYKNDFNINNFDYRVHLNFHVLTPNVEVALKKISSTKRRDIKLSLREGVEICEAVNEKEIVEFYNLLYDLYKTKIKIPLFPSEFFEKLVLNAYGKLFLVKYNQHVVGGSVCVGVENRMLYEWFVCGVDGKYKNIFPSTLATWAAIRYAADNGYQYFDMMGAGKPNEAYGVREFKSKFGGQLVEHGRFQYVTKKFLYGVGKSGLDILKRIGKI